MEIERERWHYLEKSKHLQVTNSTVLSQSVFPIRIRICIDFWQFDPDPHWEFGSGSKEGKKTHKVEKN